MRSIVNYNKIKVGDYVLMKKWIHESYFDFYKVSKIESKMITLRYGGEDHNHPYYVIDDFIGLNLFKIKYPHLINKISIRADEVDNNPITTF